MRSQKQRASIGLSIIGIGILIIIGVFIWHFTYGKQYNVKPVSTHHYRAVIKKDEHVRPKHLHYVHGTSYVHPITIIYTNLMSNGNKPLKPVMADNKAAAIGSAKQYIRTTANRKEYHTYVTPVHITTAVSQFYVRVTEVNAVFIKKNQSK